MNFKIVYAGFAFALVVAACGEKPDPAESVVAPNPALASQASGIATVEAMGAMQGGGALPEMKEFAQKVGSIGDAMATVKDEASARKAAAAIAETNAELEALAKVMNGWTEDQKRAASMSAAGDLVSAQQKIAMASANIAATNPQLMQIISEELRNLPSPN